MRSRLAVAHPATITLSSLADGDRPALVASYELVAADPADQQPLGLDFRKRPFEPCFVRCSAAPKRWKFRRWMVATGKLPIPLARGATWHRATLDVGVRWKGRDGCPRWIDDPYARVPEELPAPVHWRASHEFPRPRVVLERDLADRLVAYLGGGLHAEQGHRGPHTIPIAGDVARNWWGAGCEIHGAVANQLASGIAFAAALFWGEAHAPADYFEHMLAKYRARVHEVVAGARPMREQEIHRLLGVPLYDWLSADGARWEALRELTRRAWGSRIDGTAVLDWIADARLDLRPTFAMAVQRL